ncbi:hypothetical protein ACQ9BO_23210 [Flavobacterium sp. P21]|uniref:hypothetical protein n=1 Tax=Flavobacterium sp. P21 TaxID=3423948 RepID=UPI003D66E9C1
MQKEAIEKVSGVPESEIQKAQEIFRGAYDIIIASSVNDENLKKISWLILRRNIMLILQKH